MVKTQVADRTRKFWSQAVQHASSCSHGMAGLVGAPRPRRAGFRHPSAAGAGHCTLSDASPSSITQARIQARGSTVNAMNRTEPSPKTTFTPLGWLEPK